MEGRYACPRASECLPHARLIACQPAGLLGRTKGKTQVKPTAVTGPHTNTDWPRATESAPSAQAHLVQASGNTVQVCQ